MNKNNFLMFSNIFLLLPVIFSIIYQEWLYLFFSTGISLFSTLYHWESIHLKRMDIHKKFRLLDWLFAIGSFSYMYFYTYINTASTIRFFLISYLTIVILFFFYGWKAGNYEKLHPWFHIIAGMVSAVILITAHY